MDERNLFYKYEEDIFGDLVLSVSAKFAKGNQIKSGSTSHRHVESKVEIPASTWDMLKHVLISWIPVLRFGWLVPKYKWIETEITINETTTYFNVYPIETENRKGYVDMIRMSPVEWLCAEPMNKIEYREAEVKQFSGRDCAEFVASCGNRGKNGQLR